MNMRIKYTDINREILRRRHNRGAAFTLLELLIVIVIIAALSALMFPALNGIVNSARATTATYALRDIVNGTVNWSVDHGNRIPSPIYSSNDYEPDEEAEYNPTGTGLWCDGVLFKNIYPDTDPATPSPSLATAGGHLIGTVFESIASVNANPDELDWYKHSYGMNKSLVHDEINKDAADPDLTEKNMVNIEYLSSAMIFMDSPDANVIDAETMPFEALENASKRYLNKFVLVAYLDGHIVRMNPAMIPPGDPNSNRDASRFWRGVDEK